MLESFVGCTRWTTSGCPFLTTQTLFVRLDDIPLIISCAGHVPRALSYICRTSDLFLYSYAGLEWRIGVNRYFPRMSPSHRRLSAKWRTGDCHPDLFRTVGRARMAENGLRSTIELNAGATGVNLRAAVWQGCFIRRLPSPGTC